MVKKFLPIKIIRKLDQSVFGSPLQSVFLLFKGLSFGDGFSLCLRVQFQFFNENCLFESAELRMYFRDYKSKVGGAMKIDKRTYVFGWPGEMLEICFLGSI
jgi:hypothetical protein